MAIRKGVTTSNPKVLAYFPKVEVTRRSMMALMKRRNAAEDAAIKFSGELAVAIKSEDTKRIAKLSKQYQSELKKSTALQMQINRMGAEIGKLAILADKSGSKV